MSGKLKKKFKKYIEFFITKIRVIKEQKTFRYGEVSRRYIFKEEKNAKELVVVFSACTRKGIRARYNYVRTLNDIPCSRLYILDDTAADHRGGYYLGHNCNFKEEEATQKLIEKIIQKTAARKVLFCGSSKGGYAALNIGASFENSYMIVGAPQYYLASYLEESRNFDTLRHIIGEKTEEKYKMLQYYLKNKLANNPYVGTQKVYIHYSDQEHTYEEHVKDLLKDMKEAGYVVEEDVADYKEHSDISYYYPDFLRNKVKEILFR